MPKSPSRPTIPQGWTNQKQESIVQNIIMVEDDVVEEKRYTIPEGE